MSQAPLVVIVGPTASGKTSLAIRLAKQFGGEIISADSRAIYRGLDIGTAKPTAEEQAIVKHWAIDIIEPGERFTAADFKAYALEKVRDIRARGKVPFLVGGTGLYINAVVYDYQFPADRHDQSDRAMYEKMTIEQLHKYCHKHNVELPENDRNKRYVINTILRKNELPKRRQAPRGDVIIVGITTEKETLIKRIGERADIIVGDAVIEEAERSAKMYGWENEAMKGNIYPLLREYIEKTISLDEIKSKFRILDWQLAKRQLTWFRRDESIKWLTLDEAYSYLAQQLETVGK